MKEGEPIVGLKEELIVNELFYANKFTYCI